MGHISLIKRKNITVLDIDAYKTANPQFNISYQVAPYKNTGLYNQKYLPRKGQTSGQVELNYLNNFKLIYKGYKMNLEM